MSENQHNFQVETTLNQALRFNPEEDGGEDTPRSQLTRWDHRSFSISREVILRLIDWLEQM